MAVTTKEFGDHSKPVFGKRPTTVIIDDVFGDSSGTASYKEKPMELFKFTTTKPSAEVIWDTLLKADIKHAEGTSLEHFRFAMFCIFQLEPYFKKAKKTALGTSRVYDAATLLGITKDQFLSISTNIPTRYPHWVDESLYHPYYMAKQLFHLGVDGTMCFQKLLDRPEGFSEKERVHIDADWMGYSSKYYSGLTSWMLDNVSVDYYFQHSIKFSTNSTKAISDKVELVQFIKDQLQKSIEATENHLIPVGAFTHIPEFVRVPSMPMPPPPPYDLEEIPF